MASALIWRRPSACLPPTAESWRGAAERARPRAAARCAPCGGFHGHRGRPSRPFQSWPGGGSRRPWPACGRQTSFLNVHVHMTHATSRNAICDCDLRPCQAVTTLALINLILVLWGALLHAVLFVVCIIYPSKNAIVRTSILSRPGASGGVLSSSKPECIEKVARTALDASGGSQPCSASRSPRKSEPRESQHLISTASSRTSRG